MNKILVTGFHPFGGEHINPSFEAVKLLKNNYQHFEIVQLEVPTAFFVSSRIVIEKIKEINPEIIIMVGQAGGRKEISVERIAINLNDTNTPDNLGIAPKNDPISMFGQNAYFSTLPLENIINRLKNAYIPCSISNSAGTYVCNHLMYSVLHELNLSHENKTLAGFIHVPFIKEQILYKQHFFALDLNIIVDALEIIILESIDAYQKKSSSHASP